ncbi:hypothetical protein SP21_43 [Salmonella phage 21]|nr:hypothetical protein SP21_43 [Salmonella phage 21]
MLIVKSGFCSYFLCISQESMSTRCLDTLLHLVVRLGFIFGEDGDSFRSYTIRCQC